MDNHCLLLWDWQNGILLQRTQLPFRKASLCKDLKISFTSNTNQFIIVDNNTVGGYSISVWNFEYQDKITLIFSTEVELNESAIDLGIISSELSYISIIFFTSEQNCIKIWTFEQGTLRLDKRLYVK